MNRGHDTPNDDPAESAIWRLVLTGSRAAEEGVCVAVIPVMRNGEPYLYANGMECLGPVAILTDEQRTRMMINVMKHYREKLEKDREVSFYGGGR